MLNNKLRITNELAKEEERITKLKALLPPALNDRESYMNRIDASYKYEGYNSYTRKIR